MEDTKETMMGALRDFQAHEIFTYKKTCEQNKPLDLTVRKRSCSDSECSKWPGPGCMWEPVMDTPKILVNMKGWHPVPLKRRRSNPIISPLTQTLQDGPIKPMNVPKNMRKLTPILLQNATKTDVTSQKTTTSILPPRSSILRPSALSGFGSSFSARPMTDFHKITTNASSSSKPAFKLKPSVLSCSGAISSSAIEPAAKRRKSDENQSTDETKDTEKSITSSESEVPKSEELVSSSTEKTKDDKPTVDATISSSTSKIESIKEPSSCINGSTGSSEAVSTKPSFIFGQNIQKKVIGIDEADSSSKSNGSSANLFTEAANVDSWATSGKSLQESSKELTERELSQKRKYDEVEVITGEETECNVIQMICKLYAWGSNCWNERGRGTLRLNDKMETEGLYSRLVVRTQGTLTVMLNTKIWADMVLEKVGEKSIRFTACDNEGQPKIYLVNGTAKDISKLYSSLQCRVRASNKKPINVSSN